MNIDVIVKKYKVEYDEKTTPRRGEMESSTRGTLIHITPSITDDSMYTLVRAEDSKLVEIFYNRWTDIFAAGTLK